MKSKKNPPAMEVKTEGQDFLARLEAMSVEEKLSMLGESERAYVRGYVDRAVEEQRRIRRD